VDTANLDDQHFEIGKRRGTWWHALYNRFGRSLKCPSLVPYCHAASTLHRFTFRFCAILGGSWVSAFFPFFWIGRWALCAFGIYLQLTRYGDFLDNLIIGWKLGALRVCCAPEHVYSSIFPSVLNHSEGGFYTYHESNEKWNRICGKSSVAWKSISGWVIILSFSLKIELWFPILCMGRKRGMRKGVCYYWNLRCVVICTMLCMCSHVCFSVQAQWHVHFPLECNTAYRFYPLPHVRYHNLGPFLCYGIIQWIIHRVRSFCVIVLSLAGYYYGSTLIALSYYTFAHLALRIWTMLSLEQGPEEERLWTFHRTSVP